MRETPRGLQFERQVAASAETRINGQHDREWQGRLAIKNGYFLIPAVFFQVEIFFLEIGYRRAMLVSHSNEHVDQFYVHFESGG